MKCIVCEQDGLKWYNKLLMAITLPMKCKNCDARHELGATATEPPGPLQGTWNFLMDWLAWLVLLLVLAVIYLLAKFLIWPAAIVAGVMLLFLVTWFIPHRLNAKDPVNDLVLRIQAKKNKGPTIKLN